MIRIYRQLGSDPAMLDLLTTADPIEAEVHFLRLIQTRTDGPGKVLINPGRTHALDPAHYRTDADWTSEREQVPERRRQQWDPDGDGPTQAQIRAVERLADLTGAAAARLVGASDGRTWRRWVGSERRMPYAAYWWLLVVTGWHPEFGRKAVAETSR